MATTVRKKSAPDVIGTQQRPLAAVPKPPKPLSTRQRQWWRVLWRTPVAATWTHSDEPLVWTLATLYARNEEPDAGPGVAGQIANIGSQLGLSPRSRIVLTIEVRSDEPTDLTPGRRRFAGIEVA